MKAMLISLASALIALPAQAVTFNCQGAYTSRGNVQLRCDETACAATGWVTSAVPGVVNAPTLTFNNCGGPRRPETTATRYQNLAYYDVLDSQCWASYIRVSKNFDSNGLVAASLVNSRGAPVEDHSGYQYIALMCQLQK